MTMRKALLCSCFISLLALPALGQVDVVGAVSAVTVGNSSAQVLAKGPRRYLDIKNESATASIACNFGGTAALNTAGNYTIPPGWHKSWPDGGNTNFVPSDTINCIASASSTPATLTVY